MFYVLEALFLSLLCLHIFHIFHQCLLISNPRIHKAFLEIFLKYRNLSCDDVGENGWMLGWAGSRGIRIWYSTCNVYNQKEHNMYMMVQIIHLFCYMCLEN